MSMPLDREGVFHPACLRREGGEVAGSYVRTVGGQHIRRAPKGRPPADPGGLIRVTSWASTIKSHRGGRGGEERREGKGQEEGERSGGRNNPFKGSPLSYFHSSLGMNSLSLTQTPKGPQTPVPAPPKPLSFPKAKATKQGNQSPSSLEVKSQRPSYTGQGRSRDLGPPGQATSPPATDKLGDLGQVTASLRAPGSPPESGSSSATWAE